MCEKICAQHEGMFNDLYARIKALEEDACRCSFFPSTCPVHKKTSHSAPQPKECPNVTLQCSCGEKVPHPPKQPTKVEKKIDEIYAYHSDGHVLKETASLHQRLCELVALVRSEERSK